MLEIISYSFNDTFFFVKYTVQYCFELRFVLKTTIAKKVSVDKATMIPIRKWKTLHPLKNGLIFDMKMFFKNLNSENYFTIFLIMLNLV